MNIRLRINVFVPFLNKFDLLLTLLPHTFPFDKLPALRLPFDPVAHCRNYHRQPKKSRGCDLVFVQGYRKGDTNQNSCRHDDGKNDSAEILNCVEDEELPNGRTDGENEEVKLYLGMAADEGKCRPEHAIMKQSNE